MGQNANGQARAGKEARAAVMGRVWSERDRQDELWPEQAPGASAEPLDTSMVAILAEEIGEVAKAVLEGKAEDLRTELVQTAAVCVKWLEIVGPTGAAADVDDPRPGRELGAAITDPGSDDGGWR